MATRNIVPRANNEGKIGTITKRWQEVNTNKLVIRPTADGNVLEVLNSNGIVLFVIDTENGVIEAKSGVRFKGDGSLLTGVSGSVGHSSDTDVTIEADTDNNGTGDIVFKIRGKEVFRIPNSYAQSLQTGIVGNYVLKTVADNFSKEVFGGYLFDGVDDYLTIADNINNQFTQDSEFTFVARWRQLKLLSQSTSTATYIIGKDFKYGKEYIKRIIVYLSV